MKAHGNEMIDSLGNALDLGIGRRGQAYHMPNLTSTLVSIVRILAPNSMFDNKAEEFGLHFYRTEGHGANRSCVTGDNATTLFMWDG